MHCHVVHRAGQHAGGQLTRGCWHAAVDTWELTRVSRQRVVWDVASQSGGDQKTRAWVVCPAGSIGARGGISPIIYLILVASVLPRHYAGPLVLRVPHATQVTFARLVSAGS